MGERSGELLSRLEAGDVVLADGAIGTLLIDEGLPPGRCPEALNLERPGLLTRIAAAYVTAGAEIVQTNTFGASPAKLAQFDLQGEAVEINCTAVRAAREATDGRAFLSGSCGPSGRILEPYGDADPEEIRASFLLQMEALLSCGVDLLSIETMTDLAEAKIAIAAARSLTSDLPILASMTFDRTPKGFFTIMGNSIADAAAGLADAGATVVGSNCGNGCENMIEICREFRRHTDLPLVTRPNAGLPQMRNGRAVYGETPEFMAEKAEELLVAGTTVLGGCCGTTPDHVRSLREMIDRRGNPR